MYFTDLEDLKEKADIFYSADSLHEIKLLLIGGNEKVRKTSCRFVKNEVLPGILSSFEYDIPIIDLKTDEINTIYDDRWERIGNKNDKIYMPIFHHTEYQSYLPLYAFDRSLPGIFSISRNGLNELRRLNASKTGCYDCVSLD